MKLSDFIKEIIRKYPRKFLFLLLLMGTLSLVEMVTIINFAPLIDLITKPNLVGASSITLKILKLISSLSLPPNLITVSVLVLSLFFVKAFVAIIVFAAMLRIKYSLIRDIISNTYKSYFDAGWPFFVNNSQGMLGNTFVKEITKIGDAFGGIATAFIRLFQIFFYLCVAFYVSWRLSLLIVIATALFSLPFMFLGKRSYRYGKENMETANRMFEIIHENLNSAKIIISYGKEKEGARTLDSTVDRNISATFKYQVLDNFITIAFQPIGMAILLVSVLLSQLVFNISLARLAIVFYSFYTAMPFLSQVISAKNSVQNLLPAYDQINALKESAEKFRIVPKGNKAPLFESNITLDKVSFMYDKERGSVLKDINISIPAKKMVALVGRTGGGKTTIADLIMRLYDDYEGSITLDGVDIREVDIAGWRSKIGYVPQENILFNMSIRDNLKWVNENATDGELRHACEVAYANEFIDKMPKGLDTLVGDKGLQLSGGQRQRLALARAVLRKPELIILDEATSSLDSHSEKLIQEALANIAKDMTIFIISHRISTVVNADRIYLMSEGTIKEEGDFNSLCETKGEFYEMAHLQGLI